MNITIKDVAKEAKVAISTVSRVLADSDKISEETKERVREVIKKLNYTPNAVARGLANNKTRILAILLPDGAEKSFENPFFVQVMKGISKYAQKENYYIMYAFNDNKNDDKWIKNFVKSNLIDGLFIFNVTDDDLIINYLRNINFPFVIIGRPKKVDNILWVDNDNFDAMYKLTQTLIKLGNKRIAFIGAKSEMNMSKDRLDGYKKALFSRGIEIVNELIIEKDDFTEANGYEAAKYMLVKQQIDAFITTDDFIAFGVQKAISEYGYKNISVVGFNNIPISQYQNPPLSSVDINSEKLGVEASKILIHRLEGKSSKSYSIIDTRLILRKSVKQIHENVQCKRLHKYEKNKDILI